jgi:hypothetical protein
VTPEEERLERERAESQSSDGGDDSRGQPEGGESITDEIARKYDPERLLGMVSKSAGRGQSLDHSVRQRYEKRFGVDLGHVRVYTGEFAEEFNRQRGAYAVTIGSTGMILMGGSPDRSMGSAAGKALLAHELTHVAQASSGLHRKSFGSAMPFAHEEAQFEAAAEQVEAEVHHEEQGGAQAAHDLVGKMRAAEEHEEKIEQIKARAIELVEDALRGQSERSGSQRRA